MKIVLLLLVFFVCIFIGFAVSRKYRVRANFFKAMITLCQKFDIEINYSRERLKNIFLNLDSSIKNDLSGIDKNFLLFIDKETPLDKNSLFDKITFLKEDEKDILFNFFRSLGRSDIESQSKEIKNYLNRFEQVSQNTILENKKYGTLSVKLGVIAGLLLIVIFI